MPRRPKSGVNERPAPTLGSDEIVRAFGPIHSRIYVLGERAGAEEYERGCPFVGRAGTTLREWFDHAKLDWDKVRRWNVCIDYKKGNLKPLASEIKRDRPKVEADIVRCQPVVIAAVGAHATRWCLKRRPRPKLAEVHGKPWPVQIGDHKSVCVPIYHPSTYGRSDRAKKGKADVLIVARVAGPSAAR